MARWTDFVIAHRKRILAAWLVLFLLGGFAASNLGGLLTNRFSVPGAESERGLELLKDRMGDRSDGAFTLVATGVDAPAEARGGGGGRAAGGGDGRPRGKAGPLLQGRPRRRLPADLDAAREPGRGEASRPDLREAIGQRAGRHDVPVAAIPRSTTTRRRSSARTSGAASRSRCRSRCW